MGRARNGTVAMNEPVLIFDGDCGICTRSKNWFQRHSAKPFRAVPFQALRPDELVDWNLTIDEVQRAAYWIDSRNRAFRGSAGIARALLICAQPWRTCGALLRIPPISWIAIPVYALIARNRHHLAGSTCGLDPAAPHAGNER